MTKVEFRTQRSLTNILKEEILIVNFMFYGLKYVIAFELCSTVDRLVVKLKCVSHIFGFFFSLSLTAIFFLSFFLSFNLL